MPARRAGPPHPGRRGGTRTLRAWYPDALRPVTHVSAARCVTPPAAAWGGRDLSGLDRAERARHPRGAACVRKSTGNALVAAIAALLVVLGAVGGGFNSG